MKERSYRKSRKLTSVLLAAVLVLAAFAAPLVQAATVAHEGFGSPATVDGLLSGAGHTPTALFAAQVEGGDLLSAGQPAYDVFIISRRTTFGASSIAYTDAVQDYIDAGGSIVGEWSGSNMFFSSYDADIRNPAQDQPQLGTFQGIVHAGYYHDTDTPIWILDLAHPTVQGIPNPLIEGGGTEFFFWIEDPDPALQIVAIFEGNGKFAFPLGEELPTLLTGCSGNSTFVFGTWDWNDTLILDADNALFMNNAVAYAASGAACDSDGDGVPNPDDFCPDTVIPEGVPTERLGVNRWALVDDDFEFDTTFSEGEGPGRAYSTSDTAGCSCEQIIGEMELGFGHGKFGCSISAMDDWVGLMNP
jgi:hypothetical protein